MASTRLQGPLSATPSEDMVAVTGLTGAPGMIFFMAGRAPMCSPAALAVTPCRVAAETTGSGSPTPRSIDTITDFVSGSDHIDLGFIIPESQFHFIGAAAFSGHAGQGRYANGMFQLDINGDRIPDFAIASAGHMAAGDFDFIASGWWDYPIYL
jgi:hypothetical protein